MTAIDDESSAKRRRFCRRPVHLQASVRLGGRDLAAVAENICPGGAFLRVDLPRDLNAFEASISLPHGKDLRVLAKVRWRSDDPGGVGIEFEDFLAGRD